MTLDPINSKFGIKNKQGTGYKQLENTVCALLFENAQFRNVLANVHAPKSSSSVNHRGDTYRLHFTQGVGKQQA